jgi:hypothetical protein
VAGRLNVRNVWKADTGLRYPVVMTEAKIQRLYDRLAAGEQPIDDLRALRQRGFKDGVDAERAEALSDLWNLVLHCDLLPALDTAKALVELAAASDTSYPILINDGLIYDALNPRERAELVQFIRQCLAQANAPHAELVLIHFVDDLLGSGPRV